MWAFHSMRLGRKPPRHDAKTLEVPLTDSTKSVLARYMSAWGIEKMDELSMCAGRYSHIENEG